MSANDRKISTHQFMLSMSQQKIYKKGSFLVLLMPVIIWSHWYLVRISGLVGRGLPSESQGPAFDPTAAIRCGTYGRRNVPGVTSTT